MIVLYPLYVPPRPVLGSPGQLYSEPLPVPVPVASEPKVPEPTIQVPEPTESIYFKLRNKLKINMPTSIATQAAIKVVPKFAPHKLVAPKLLRKKTAVSDARFAFCTALLKHDHEKNSLSNITFFVQRIFFHLETESVHQSLSWNAHSL